MITAPNISMHLEEGGFASLYCTRCRAYVGRIQVEPEKDAGVSTEDWDAQVRGEVELLTREHETQCPSARRS